MHFSCFISTLVPIETTTICSCNSVSFHLLLGQHTTSLIFKNFIQKKCILKLHDITLFSFPFLQITLKITLDKKEKKRKPYFAIESKQSNNV